jgi:nitroimidazol reductase NimA-like FMN-containing flavoprotein (pyridoxamine 5'-phosphate oxidase superfamily)
MANYSKMRKSDREITDFTGILDVLKRADTIRLGMNGDPYPYVVPLSYGFEALNDGGVAVYAHGAAEGLKHELIARDNRVCVEAGIFHRYVSYGEGDGASVTAEYESVIGFGTAEIAEGADAERGMELMLEHCGFPGFKYNKETLGVTRIYKFTLERITGKRRLI